MRYKPDSLKPIPWPIAMDLQLIKRGLNAGEFEREIKRVVRRHITPPHPKLNTQGMFQLYDARIWNVIHEVLSEN